MGVMFLPKQAKLCAEAKAYLTSWTHTLSAKSAHTGHLRLQSRGKDISEIQSEKKITKPCSGRYPQDPLQNRHKGMKPVLLIPETTREVTQTGVE